LASGASLVARDYLEVTVEQNRLDGGGRSRVAVRVINVLAYTALKVQAFQDRHENKDAYDLVYVLLNYPGGPVAAGKVAAQSLIANEPRVKSALNLLEDRFAVPDLDGPIAYAEFVADAGDPQDTLRRRQEAVATVRAFLRGIQQGPLSAPTEGTL
jgi:hypothetical protein